ncbi:MAG: hypothetical protein AB7I50_24765 [Vicinamibacterales bacterium]
MPVGSDPFFAPDGRWIGYTTGNTLYKVSVTGGPALRIADVSPGAIGSWDANGIVLADARGLFRVSSDGGLPEPIRVMGLDPGEQLAFPEPLPGGETVLVTVIPGRTSDAAAVEVRGDPVQMAPEVGSADFAVSSDGFLIYVTGGAPPNARSSG